MEGTPFDFRTEKTIGRDAEAEDEQLAHTGGYDHNFCLNGNGFRQAGSLECRESGLGMRFITDMPGAQIYTGNYKPDQGENGKKAELIAGQDGQSSK